MFFDIFLFKKKNYYCWFCLLMLLLLDKSVFNLLFNVNMFYYNGCIFICIWWGVYVILINGYK